MEAQQLELPPSDDACLDLQCLIIGDWSSGTFSMKTKKSDRVRDLQLRLKKLKFDHNVDVRVDGLYVYRARQTNKWYFHPTTSEWLKERNDIHGLTFEHQHTVLRWTREKLDPESTIEDAFPSIEQDCVHVLVAPPKRLSVETPRDQQLLFPYQEAAQTLKNAEEVVELAQLVKQYSAVETPPFILLQGSAGEGKTQMAFNLMAREDVGVFYVPCSKVDWEFTDRFEAFKFCLEKDLPEVGEATASDLSKRSLLYTYGFIWALLTGVSTFTGPRTRDELVAALEAWQVQTAGKCCVLFLDEIPALWSEDWKNRVLKYRMMANMCRSLGIVTILSVTHRPAGDLREITRDLRGDREFWGVVFPRFPRFRDPAMSSLRYDLREIIGHSRPLFAKAALDYAIENPLDNDTSLAVYMDKMARFVARGGRIDPDFCGQVSIFYAASYVGRYNDFCRIVDHYARLRDSDKFELWINSSGDLLKKVENGLVEWDFCSFLPTPAQDPLLHLCLAGGKGFSAFKDRIVENMSYTSAVRYQQRLVNDALYFSQDLNALRLEALAAGAIVAASHHNGLAGISFGKLLSSLMFELNMQKSSEIQLRLPANVLEFVSCLLVPFLAPPNVKWPSFLVEMDLNLGTLSRLTFKDKGDISFMDGKVSVECISPRRSIPQGVMRRLLTWVPDDSAVHLVVTHSLRRHYFRTRQHRLDGGEPVYENFRQNLPKSLRDAHFYRIGVLSGLGEKDERGGMWRNDLEEIRGMGNADPNDGPHQTGRGGRPVSKLVVFLELNRSRKRGLQAQRTKRRKLN